MVLSPVTSFRGIVGSGLELRRILSPSSANFTAQSYARSYARCNALTCSHAMDATIPGAASWLLTAGPAVAHAVLHFVSRSDGSEHWISYGEFREGKWWLPITATIAHNGPEHLVVNICLYSPVVVVLEPVLGVTGSVAVFYVAAAAGWAASLFSSRLRYPDSHAFVQTCGASPGLYGSMYCAAALAPTAAVAAPMWAWALARAFLPPAAALALNPSGRRHPAATQLALTKLRDSVGVGVAAAVAVWLTGAKSTVAWLLLCNGINVAQRALQLLREPQLRSLEYAAADEASHLGGAALGLLVAAAITVARDGGGSVLQPSLWQAFGHWAVVCACFCGLALRHVTRF